MVKLLRKYRAADAPLTATIFASSRFKTLYIVHDDVGTIYYNRLDSIDQAVLSLHMFIPRGYKKPLRWELLPNAPLSL